MSHGLLEFTGGNFEQEVLKSEVPVLVDFTATWCGPCKAIKPTVAELAGEYAGRVKVGTLDIDQNQPVAVKYHVRAVPTLMVFKGGKVHQQVLGAVNKKRLKDMFDSALNG
jgi:thioredoxin 1